MRNNSLIKSLILLSHLLQPLLVVVLQVFLLKKDLRYNVILVLFHLIYSLLGADLQGGIVFSQTLDCFEVGGGKHMSFTFPRI